MLGPEVGSDQFPTSITRAVLRFFHIAATRCKMSLQHPPLDRPSPRPSFSRTALSPENRPSQDRRCFCFFLLPPNIPTLHFSLGPRMQPRRPARRAAQGLAQGDPCWEGSETNARKMEPPPFQPSSLFFLLYVEKERMNENIVE